MAENAVTLKLPTFWNAQPEVWFAQAEAQFHIRNITNDATKYYYVISALDQDTAGRLLDVIRTPPAADKYANLKDNLLRTFGLTRRERAAKLLQMTSLGDRKPSFLLAEMRALSDGHTDCMLFEELFLRQMPDDIRLQLAQADFGDLDAIARQADALWQARPQATEFSGLHKLVKKPHLSDSDSTSREGWCFYHTKFGSKAKKCRAPCTFSGNAPATRQ
jgi:hypothetical protein